MGNSITIAGQRQDHRTLALAGDINVFMAADLHRNSLEASQGASIVTLDCHQLLSLDIAALQILVALKDAMAAQGGSLQIAGLSKEVAGTVRLAGLADRLGISNGLVAKDDTV
jgi:anti-anti-sigma factor